MIIMFKFLFKLIFLGLIVLFVIDAISYFKTGNFDSSLLLKVWDWIVAAFNYVKNLIAPTT